MRLWVSPPLKAGVFLISQLVSAGDAKETKHPHTPTPTPHTWLSSTLSADSTTWPVSASVSRCLASRGSSRRSSGQASMFRRSAVKSTYLFAAFRFAKEEISKAGMNGRDSMSCVRGGWVIRSSIRRESEIRG